MPLTLLNNRISLSSFRGFINACITLVNSLETQVTAAESDITTLQSDMATAQAGILLKQNANAISTLNDGYRATAISINVLTTDYNKILHVTNAGATNVTFTAPSTLAAFANDGGKFLVYNDATSVGAVTLVASGCTLVGNTNVSQGETVWIIRTGATTWTRLAFA